MNEFLQYLNPRDTKLNEKLEDLFNKLYIEELVIYQNRMAKTKRLKEVPSYFRPDEYVKRTEYTFKLPYTGDPNLFDYHGSRICFDGMELGVHRSYVEFQILDECNSAEQVAKEMDDFLRRLSDHIKSVNEGARAYNESLKQSLEGFVSKRLDELAKKRKEEEDAGLPPDEDDVGGDITIPLVFKPKLEPHLTQPVLESREPNYALSVMDYDTILDSITRTATYMETHVDSFSYMEEEHIRDHILAMMNGMLTIRATGETFNGKGKTDILYPYKESNLFIAECKIWYGPSEFKKAVNQLEGYLGWDDTKTSLLIFYRGKESMSDKISEMRECIKSLPNFRSILSENNRGGIYILNHPQDNKKSYRLGLVVFNLSQN